jgi:dienelactone hydrolase
MGKSIQWRSRNEKEPRSYGETIRYGGRRDGGQAYLAHSDRVGPGVLVLHEGHGLQDSWIHVANRLSADGFTVLVPEIEPDVALNQLKAAVEFLRDNWHPRVGVVGFSMGGMLGIDLAATLRIDALVVFYAVSNDMPAAIDCPVQVHLAEADEVLALDEATPAFAALEDVEVLVHEGVRHSFANSSDPAFDATTADVALAATRDFFHHHLA